MFFRIKDDTIMNKGSSRKHINIHFAFLLILITMMLVPVHEIYAEKNKSKFAHIMFEDNNDDGSKTYIANLSQKELYKLKNDLAFSGSAANSKKSFNENNRDDRENYVNRIASGKYPKKRKQNAERELFGHQSIKNEKSKAKIAAAKSESLTAKYEKNKEKKDKLAQAENKIRSQKRQPAAYKKGARRIRNGQSIKKSAGNVGFLVKYSIVEDSYVNTYVTFFEDYLKEGSHYKLKYHGTGSNRKYYLEYVSVPSIN